MPKRFEEDKPKHSAEDCKGTFVTEFSDQEGDHIHCPACGAWGLKIAMGADKP